MSNLKIFAKGFGASLRSARMIAYLWLINVAFALVVVVPLWLLVRDDYGHSLWGGRLRLLDSVWVGELILKFQDIPELLTGLILVTGVLFLLLYIFLNGGIIGRLSAHPGQKISLSGFFSDCGKYFWRFVRVFLAALVTYLLLFGFVFRLVSAAFKPWIDNASYEWPSILASNLRTLVCLLLFTIVQMYFDYVKIGLVARDSTKVLKELASGLRFVFGRFFRAWGLYLLVGILYLAVTVLFMIVNKSIPRYGAPWFAAAFFWAQVYIWLRIGIKVLFFATGIKFYEAHALKAVPERLPAPAAEAAAAPKSEAAVANP